MHWCMSRRALGLSSGRVKFILERGDTLKETCYKLPDLQLDSWPTRVVEEWIEEVTMPLKGRSTR